MASPFQRQHKTERRKARQAAEALAVADLPPIVMAAPVNVQTTEVIADPADDDDTYPKLFGAPEPIRFKFGE
jgi:hypothetical protein